MTTRDILGIHFCPRCRLDTMPDERTGRCFFCDTQIVKPSVVPVVVAPSVGFCEVCDARFEIAPHARGAAKDKRFCSKRCRTRAWQLTARGQVWAEEKRARAKAKYIAGLRGDTA